MDIDENQILLLKKKLKIIKQYKGQGTQLISLYLPPDADRSSVMKQLTDEISQSANIKSQQTRKNVQGALRRIMNYLKQIDFRLPETGLVLFSGEVSPTPSKSNIILMEIVPPKRLTTKLYWCDSSFHTAPLDEMITTEDVFGLIVIDKREATIGVLRGKSQEILGHETSGVPGKFRAGGQCLKEGFVCLSNGDLISLDDCQEKQSIKSIDFNNFESEDSLILDKWNVKKNKTYDISTEFPSLEIQSSKDHLFFVCTNDGIKEKCAEELKIGDYLLMPEKINVKGKLQKLKFITPFTKNSTITKNNLPNVLNNDFAQFVGYLIGTGSVENNNISFFEKDKQVVFVYKKKYEHFFKISSNYKFRKNKNDYLLQFTNKSLINLIQTEFPEIKNTIDTTMPKKILQSPNPIVASFLKGLFDAGGDVSVKPSGVYFSTNNKKLAHQIQLVFLRFSIICSFYNFDNITNPYTKNKKYTITINDKKSLKLFKKHINFTNKTKQNNLNKIIVTTVTNNDNYKKQLLNNINKKNIVLYKKIKQFYDSPIIPIKINKINIINEISNMVDISVQNQNFIANGIIVHNSAARFERLREKAAEDFFKRVGDKVNGIFVNMPKLKGIIVGGPGNSKEFFLEHADLDHRIKDLVIGKVDTGYTDETGIKEIINRSSELLKEVGFVKERNLVNKFITQVAKDQLATYGYNEVMNVLKLGQAETILVSEDLDWLVVKYQCPSCKKNIYDIVKDPSLMKDTLFEKKCPSCGVDAEFIEELDVYEYLSEIAENLGTKVILVSTETQEGKMFYETFGGIGALLRYK